MTRAAWIVAWSVLVGAGLAGVAGFCPAEETAAATWYKGNTHCHSFWSDGDEFPEMVADWYKSHGYQFLGLSDHNILARGERWRKVHDPKQGIPESTLAKCAARFGQSALETRGEGEQLEVRLKTFDEVCRLVEEPGRFLMIEAQENNGQAEGREVHQNAINLAEAVPFRSAGSVQETFRANRAVAAEQGARLGRPMAFHLNHPSWPHYDITAEDMAALTEFRAFEICNASEGSNRLGDAEHPSTDRLWDIANTLRIADLKSPPLCAVASDDAHHYQQFNPGQANPGRGFIMVRAKELSVDAITRAIDRGDYYASTGVLLRELNYDPGQGTLSLAVDAKPGAHYTIEFIGTETGFDRTTRLIDAPPYKGKPQPPVRQYSADVGKVLAHVEGTSATYRFTGKELYVRAAVRSDKRMENPPRGESEIEEAWCQPVGWEKWLPSTP